MDEFINGYKVIGSYRLPDRPSLKSNLRIILCKNNKATKPFVTAVHQLKAEEWTDGHYFSTQKSALDDFYERCKQSFVRY